MFSIETKHIGKIEAAWCGLPITGSTSDHLFRRIGVGCTLCEAAKRFSLILRGRP